MGKAERAVEASCILTAQAHHLTLIVRAGGWLLDSALRPFHYCLSKGGREPLMTPAQAGDGCANPEENALLDLVAPA